MFLDDARLLGCGGRARNYNFLGASFGSGLKLWQFLSLILLLLKVIILGVYQRVFCGGRPFALPWHLGRRS